LGIEEISIGENEEVLLYEYTNIRKKIRHPNDKKGDHPGGHTTYRQNRYTGTASDKMGNSLLYLYYRAGREAGI
jgi:hypothetical protein